MLLALLIALTACRSQKTATATAKEVVEVESAGAISTSTAERYQWLSRLSLDIDSFELEITTPQLLDTANGQREQFALAASQPRVRSVVLRGKHASIGKADIVQRNASRFAEQVDTLSAHRTMDKSDHYARDNVGIAKPPEVTWWPWLILAGMLVGFWLYHYRKR